MKIVNNWKRWLLLLVGLTVMAFGVGLSIKASLGTSPISSLPYAVSLVSPLSVGTATILMHCTFILLQILILRRRYDPVQLLQLPVAFFFGGLTDLAVALLSGVTCESYLTQWLVCAAGIALVALGVSLEVTANVVTLAGEGLVLSLCRVTPVKFGNMKVGFDVTLVVLAVLVGLLCRHEVLGVREGTVAAAVCVGLLAKLFCKPLKAVCKG